MSSDFEKYLQLWKVSDQFVSDPSPENEEIAQKVIDEIIGQGDTEVSKTDDDESTLDKGSSESYLFALALKVLGDKRGLSTKDLAAKLAFTTASVMSWKRGRVLPRNIDTVRVIAQIWQLNEEDEKLLVDAYRNDLIARRKHLSFLRHD